MHTSLGAIAADTIEYRMIADGDHIPVGFFDSAGLTREVAGSELFDQARAAAAGLAQHGVRFQDRVIIIAPTGPDYLSVLLGCLLGGVAPATVAAPTKPADPTSAGVAHLHAAIRTVRPAAVIISDLRLAPAVPDGTVVLTIDDLRRHGSLGWSSLPRPEPGLVHHIQLTSGSTSAPKAAVLTHANVAANLRALSAATELTPHRDRMSSWLPLYHDMGLVLVLLGLTNGVGVDLMPPVGFVRDPMSWLRHISSRRATITAAPPFAYRAAADRYVDTPSLDLSSLRQAYVGAEPIAVGVLQHFQATFAGHGLAGSALVPCYGMAETVLATTLATQRHSPSETTFGRVRWHDFDRAALDDHRLARPGQPGQPVRTIVSCGTPVDGLSLRITNSDGREVLDGEIGAIGVRGSSVLAGYLTPDGRSAPADGWHDTGDLGLRLDGELYVVGRTKEMLIVRGRNLPPYDIERVVEDHPLVSPGASAVFSYTAENTATEQIVAVVETRAKPDQWPLLHTELTTTVRQVFGLSLADVIIAPRGTIPRTTSGKRQRQALRNAYLAGHLTRGTPPGS